MGRRAGSPLVWPLVAAAVSTALVTACSEVVERSEDRRAPHIVLIVADDLGWADVGYHAEGVRTPSIDALAREGVELDCFYGSPICSASRAALLTGRYPIRYGLARAVIPPWREYGLDTDEITLADVLGSAGYEHRALFGKWHLGHLDRRWHPLERGFTRFRGHLTGAIDYVTKERQGERDWHDDYEPDPGLGYSTDLIADAASRFILERADEGPLFCVVAFNAPHPPYQAPDEYLERFRSLADPDGSLSREQVRSAMIACLDDGIGRVTAAIDRAGIRDDTLVWFLSDNGAGAEVADRNLPLRGAKSTVFEGGVRVPAAVRWPRRLPGDRVCTTPLSVLDVLPTMMQAAGIAWRAGKPLDGIGALELLAGEGSLAERDLLFFYGQEGPLREQLAIRTSRWKLHVHGPSLADGPVSTDHQRLLFDIGQDPGETTDLASEHPALVEELTRRLVAFRGLQPDDAIPHYWAHSEGFEPPRSWSVD